MTPYVAIIFFGVIALILVTPGKITLLADLYAFGSMISFTAAHLSVIALRYREPELERPFRAPFNVRLVRRLRAAHGRVRRHGHVRRVVRHRLLPAAEPPDRLRLDGAWASSGYVDLPQDQGLLAHADGEDAGAAHESMQQDVVYDQLLVPLTGTQVSDEMMVLACQLATERNSSIIGLYVIEVPINLPIDAKLTHEHAVAAEVLAEAEHAAENFGVKLTPALVMARSAGRAIVEEAIARRSEVIVLGSQSKRRVGDRVFGRTIEYVLEHLPCEAIINVVPKGTPSGAAVGGEAVARGHRGHRSGGDAGRGGGSSGRREEGRPAASPPGSAEIPASGDSPHGIA